jgi:hypothetical protein
MTTINNDNVNNDNVNNDNAIKNASDFQKYSMMAEPSNDKRNPESDPPAKLVATAQASRNAIPLMEDWQDKKEKIREWGQKKENDEHQTTRHPSLVPPLAAYIGKTNGNLKNPISIPLAAYELGYSDVLIKMTIMIITYAISFDLRPSNPLYPFDGMRELIKSTLFIIVTTSSTQTGFPPSVVNFLKNKYNSILEQSNITRSANAGANFRTMEGKYGFLAASLHQLQTTRPKFHQSYEKFLTTLIHTVLCSTCDDFEGNLLKQHNQIANYQTEDENEYDDMSDAQRIYKYGTTVVSSWEDIDTTTATTTTATAAEKKIIAKKKQKENSLKQQRLDKDEVTNSDTIAVYILGLMWTTLQYVLNNSLPEISNTQLAYLRNNTLLFTFWVNMHNNYETLGSIVAARIEAFNDSKMVDLDKLKCYLENPVDGFGDYSSQHSHNCTIPTSINLFTKVPLNDVRELILYNMLYLIANSLTFMRPWFRLSDIPVATLTSDLVATMNITCKKLLMLAGFFLPDEFNVCSMININGRLVLNMSQLLLLTTNYRTDSEGCMTTKTNQLCPASTHKSHPRNNNGGSETWRSTMAHYNPCKCMRGTNPTTRQTMNNTPGMPTMFVNATSTRQIPAKTFEQELEQLKKTTTANNKLTNKKNNTPNHNTEPFKATSHLPKKANGQLDYSRMADGPIDRHALTLLTRYANSNDGKPCDSITALSILSDYIDNNAKLTIAKENETISGSTESIIICDQLLMNGTCNGFHAKSMYITSLIYQHAKLVETTSADSDANTLILLLSLAAMTESNLGKGR